MGFPSARIKVIMNFTRSVILFLVLVEGLLANQLPLIPHLKIWDGDHLEIIHTDVSTPYSPLSFDQFSIECMVEQEDEEDVTVTYIWSLEPDQISLDESDDFLVDQGNLTFIEPIYGTFECRAESELGISYSFITLTSQKPDTDDPQAILKTGPDHKTVLDGSQVTFICEVESTDFVNISWSFNSQPVMIARPEWKVMGEEQNKQSLLIAKVVPEDQGVVGCMVAFDSGKIYKEGLLSIIQEAPIISAEFVEMIKVLKGNSVDILCEASGSPVPEVKWKQVLGEGNLPNLVIKQVDETTEEDYVCEASNSVGTVEKSLKIVIFSRLKAGKDIIMEAPAGDHLDLDCELEIDDKWEDNDIWKEWWRGEEKLNQYIGQSKISVPSLVPEQEGSYYCLAGTPLNDTIKRVFDVTVGQAPKISPFSSVLTVLEGSNIELPCSTSGKPHPEIVWQKNGEEVLESGRVNINGNGGLTVTSISQADTGEYVCRASNKWGVVERGVGLRVAIPTQVGTGLRSITGMAGEEVNIGCEVEVDDLLVDSLTRQWVKGGQPLSQSLLQGPAEETVFLKYLVGERAGLYECNVNTALDSVVVETQLTVHSLPPRILRQPARLGQVVGGNVTLECEAEGIPPPTISFKFGTIEISGTRVSSTRNSTTEQLLFQMVTPSHNGDYTCLAVNEYGNHKGTTTLDIFRRTKVAVGVESKTVNSGSMVSFDCQVNADPGLLPSVRTMWLKDENPLAQDSRISKRRDKLEIQNTTMADEGIYTCVIQSQFDKVISSGRLTVLHEAPSFTSTPIDLRVLEGRNTILDCQAVGIPEPEVSWRFEGRMLESSSGKLELQSVGRNMEGSYTCTAVNVYGKIEERVNLQVIKGIQRENENLVPDLIKNITETIVLPCDFKVDHRVEKETQFIWLKNNQNVTYDGTKYELISNKSLVIHNVALEDQAQYTCAVVTPLQREQHSVQLIVSGRSPEILNTFSKITIHEGEDLELNCAARGSPRPTLKWLVKERPVLSKYLVDVVNADQAEFITKTVRIKEAGRVHEGVYQCLAANNVGSVVKNSHVIVIRRTKVSVASEEGPGEITIQAGQKLKLPCRVDRDQRNRITNIEWTKNNASIQVGAEDRIDYGYDGSFTIFNVQKRHEGGYKCTVTTLRDKASAEVPVKVIVNAPVITRFSPNQKIFSGTSLSLECVSNGIPEPETSWTFNKTITSVSGEAYTVNSAIASDAGYYTCTARNAIGETKRTIEISVVTVPTLKEEYKVKKGTDLVLPCTKPERDVTSVWTREGESIAQTGRLLIDRQGSLVFSELREEEEGEYTCTVNILGQDDRQRVVTSMVRIIPDIVVNNNLTDKIVVKEGEGFSLKCAVLAGVNAKRMWKKDGELVFAESEGGVDILEQGGTLEVRQARLQDEGNWACVASTSWGSDIIEYNIKIVPVRPSEGRESCSELSPPLISGIESLSNTSVLVVWGVGETFNVSCYEGFKILWWTNETSSNYYEQAVELSHRKATIHMLVPETAYYFQVNLVRNSRLLVYHHGQTRTHWTSYTEVTQMSSSSNPKAVIIIVIIVIVMLATILALLYYKRREVSDYLMEKRKSRKEARDRELTDFPSKLVANPDFMASLAPQWPEPDPDPTEDQAFIQQQRQTSNRRRRGSKESITSSWSSLFNVVSTEDIPAETAGEENYRDSLYRGRYRKE